MELYQFEMNLSESMDNLGEQSFKTVLPDDNQMQLMFMNCLPENSVIKKRMRERAGCDMAKEMWSLYDKNMHLTEHIYYREDGTENIPEGLYHLCTWMYVFTRDGRLLITQRHPDKKNPLKWEVPGGSVLFGETSLQGAKREVLEETGLLLEDQQVEFLTNELGKGWILNIYYAILERDVFNMKLQEDEVVDARLVTEIELYRLYRNNELLPGVWEYYKQILNKS